MKNLKKAALEVFVDLAGRVSELISEQSDTALHVDVIKNNLFTLQEHLEDGAKVDAQRSSDGLTPLHLAAFLGYRELVELLLKYNADPNIKSYEGSFTALHAALNCKDQHNATEIAKLLMSYGARMDVLDAKGKLPFDYAYIHNNKDIEVILTDPETYIGEWYMGHMPIFDNSIPNLDVVELRFAFNRNDFGYIKDITEMHEINQNEIIKWAEAHGYEDRVEGFFTSDIVNSF